MERKLYGQMLLWKERNKRKPLILQGARQVGKTWLLRTFGEREYDSMAYVNCDSDTQIRRVFEDNYDINRIIRDLSAVTGVDILPEKTLIILDEIQEIPRALTSLKYFCENAPEYHICAAGSLLGITMNHGASYPVGKVDHLTLFPLSFEEFVRGVGGDILADRLRDGVPEEFVGLSYNYKDLLRQYYYTGGMPAVVQEYIETRSLKQVRVIQNEILTSYRNDIAKHTDPRTAVRIHQVWNSILQQLARGNKRFIFGNIQKGARAKDFEIAIQWLVDAGIIYRVPRIRKAAMPLKFYEDFNAFKLYYLDCGLMGALAETPADQVLIGDNIFEEYKGAFTEQFVLGELMNSSSKSIFYYDSDNSKQELDFIIQLEDTIAALEVKAEENLRAKSLRQFKTDHPSCIAVRLSMSDYRKQDWMINVPLYLAFRVREIVENAGESRP